MIINEIKEHALFTEELLFKLRTKKLHLVCPAKFKDSYCTEYLVGHLGMSVYEIEKFCRIVNKEKEPGCLYPNYSVTLFPIGKGLDLEFCVREVLKAQTEYFKSPEILFALDDHEEVDANEIIGQLKKALTSLPDNNLKIKACYKG